MRDPEDKNAQPIYDYSMRYNFVPKVAGRRADFASRKTLVLHGRSLNVTPCPLQLSLITRDGSVYGSTVMINPRNGDYSLTISQLKPVKLVSLPRPYPSFLPYFIDTNLGTGTLNLTDIETIQLSIGPGIPPIQLTEKHSVAISRVTLD